MGNGLLIYMMVMDARQRNEANRAISIGKRHTDCPTESLREVLKEREALRSRVGGEEEWETRLRIVKRTFPSDDLDDEVRFVD